METSMNKPNVLFADIETSLCLACVFQCGKQRVTGDQILEPTRIITIQYAFNDEAVKSLKWDKDKDDRVMLEKFRGIMEQADVVVGYNYNSFDAKTINARIAYHDIEPYNLYMVDDLFRELKKKFRLPAYSLDYVCKYFNLAGKFKHRGLGLWKDITFGSGAEYKKAMEEMKFYGENDISVMRELFKRLKPYLDLRFNRATFHENPKACPGCGSVDVIKNGSYMSSPLRKVARASCKECGKKFSYGTNMIRNSVSFGR